VVHALEVSALKPRDPQEGRGDTPDATARTDLRTRIAEEVLRQGGHPLARRTLQLLTEAAAAPQDAPPGYRIVDRAGQPRRTSDPVAPGDDVDGTGVGKTGAEPAAASDRAMTLADFVAELRTLHPALFVPPAPEAAPGPAAGGTGPDTATPAPAAPGAAARFVEARSAQARAILARSGLRGRAVAARATERWQGLRRRLTADTAATATDSTAAPAEAAKRTGGLGAFVGQAAGRARGGFADTGARLRGSMREGGVLRDRRVLAAGAGLLGLVGLIALAQGPGEGAKSPSALPATPPVADATPTASEATPPTPTEAAKPAGERASDALSGPVEVIDTATLRVAGKLVRLFGVEWVRGGQAEELTRYLAGRTVTCLPVAGSEARLCNVDGRDLSEVVLFNGGGRASAEATPDLVAAEDRARTERLGVWAR